MGSTGQLAFELGHRPALSRDDFLVADCNQAAIGFVDRWPNWPGPALVVVGPPGCGKTHLAAVFRTTTGARPIDPQQMGAADPPVLLGEARVAVIDGLRPGFPEHTLLHLYNMLRDRAGHLLITAETPPSRWPVSLPDLRSRLLAAPVVAVSAPDDALIAAMLVKLFADRQIAVSEDVVRFLVPRLERSFAAVRAFVASLDRAALSDRRPVTVPLARQVLDGMLRSKAEAETLGED